MRDAVSGALSLDDGAYDGAPAIDVTPSLRRPPIRSATAFDGTQKFLLRLERRFDGMCNNPERDCRYRASSAYFASASCFNVKV